jgi:hypothetical protein
MMQHALQYLPALSLKFFIKGVGGLTLPFLVNLGKYLSPNIEIQLAMRSSVRAGIDLLPGWKY